MLIMGHRLIHEHSVGLSAKPTRLKMVPCILKRVVISDKVRCFFRSTGQTGFHGTTQNQIFGTGQTGSGQFSIYRDGTNGIRDTRKFVPQFSTCYSTRRKMFFYRNIPCHILCKTYVFLFSSIVSIIL